MFVKTFRKAVKAIRTVNKKVVIMAGLATNNPHVETAANLVADYNAARAASVQGFWLNANNGQAQNRCTATQGGPGCPQTAIQFLQDIGRITGG